MFTAFAGALALVTVAPAAEAQNLVRPSGPCAGGQCFNNGWGNGYQAAPGSSDLNNNAANTTKVNSGMSTATGKTTNITNPDGSALTPTPTDGSSPTPSTNSRGVANYDYYTP